MPRRWKQPEPLSVKAIGDEIDRAYKLGRLSKGLRRVVGVTINCAPDLQDVAENICSALSLWPEQWQWRWSAHVYNGKPNGWWILGFIYESKSERTVPAPDACAAGKRLHADH